MRCMASGPVRQAHVLHVVQPNPRYVRRGRAGQRGCILSADGILEPFTELAPAPTWGLSVLAVGAPMRAPRTNEQTRRPVRPNSGGAPLAGGVDAHRYLPG